MTTARSSRSLAGRLGSHVVTLVLVLLTLLALAYVAPAVIGYDRYVLTGKSMTGTYDKGSIVFERPVPVEDLHVGDVITYQPPADAGTTSLVTHRIININHDDHGALVLRTQGDANPDPDPWRFTLLDTEQPVVEHAVPHAGWALIALADPQLRMLLIGIPAALIALLSLTQLIAALRDSSKLWRSRGDRVARPWRLAP